MSLVVTLLCTNGSCITYKASSYFSNGDHEVIHITSVINLNIVNLATYVDIV